MNHQSEQQQTRYVTTLPLFGALPLFLPLSLSRPKNLSSLRLNNAKKQTKPQLKTDQNGHALESCVFGENDIARSFAIPTAFFANCCTYEPPTCVCGRPLIEQRLIHASATCRALECTTHIKLSHVSHPPMKPTALTYKTQTRGKSSELSTKILGKKSRKHHIHINQDRVNDTKKRIIEDPPTMEGRSLFHQKLRVHELRQPPLMTLLPSR